MSKVKLEDFLSRDQITKVQGDLIIRGGMNIAPVEIDNILMASDLVLEGAALGVPDPIYGEEVVCVVVPKTLDVTGGEIAAYLRARLPLPKVPKKIYLAQSLPKSDRGKVLRDKLREMLPALTEAATVSLKAS